EILFGGVFLRSVSGAFCELVETGDATVVKRQRESLPDGLLFGVKLGGLAEFIGGAVPVFRRHELLAGFEALLHRLVLFLHLAVLGLALGALLFIFFHRLLLIAGAHLLAAFGRAGLHALHFGERQFLPVTAMKLELYRIGLRAF